VPVGLRVQPVPVVQLVPAGSPPVPLQALPLQALVLRQRVM
jgi:hypothetical protein